MADLIVPKRNTLVVASDLPTRGGPGSPTAIAVEGALSGIKRLQESERGGGSDTLKKSVVAALLGVALIGGVLPAHADTAQVKAPQGNELFLDGHMPTGPPDYAKLLGASTTVQKQSGDARTNAAFDAFEARFAQIVHRDAGSLAAGLRPLQSGDPLDATQQKDLERALGDLVKELPVSTFSDNFQGALKAALGGRDLSDARLGDLGKLGGDAAKDALKQLKAEHPTTFWSLAGTAAAAAVAVGYTQGTDALAKLGIKPEVSVAVFQDVKVKLGVEAGPKFSDPRVSVGLDGAHTLQSGSVIKGGIAAQIQNKSLASAELYGSFASVDGLSLGGKVRLDGNGKPFDARLSASQTFTHDVGGGGTGLVYGEALWSNGKLGTPVQSSLSLGLAATHGRWTSSVSTAYNFNNDSFSTTLSTGRTFDINRKNDLDLQFRGTVNNRGDAHLGVGVTWRF